MPMALKFGIVVALFFHANRWERERIKLEFDRRTDGLGERVQRDFDRYFDVLHSIERFFASSSIVRRQNFHAFVTRDLAQHPGIKALSWDARVRDAERTAFEEAAHADGFETFQITERDGQSNLVPADRRDEYISVRYIEPYA